MFSEPVDLMGKTAAGISLVTCTRPFGLISLWVAVLIIFGLSDSYYSPFLYQGGFTLFALAIGMIVIWLVAHSNDRVSSVLSTGPLTWIGKTSYGLYLWHSISISFFFYFQMPPWLMLISAVLSAFSLTALSYYLVELPFLRLKQRFS
jgi:peptidoglycan/LPS O-acetylase OafA/YrhL